LDLVLAPQVLIFTAVHDNIGVNVCVCLHVRCVQAQIPNTALVAEDKTAENTEVKDEKVRSMHLDGLHYEQLVSSFNTMLVLTQKMSVKD